MSGGRVVALAGSVLALAVGGALAARGPSAATSAAEGELTLVQNVRPELDTPWHRVADLGGDGRDELLSLIHI